MLAYFLSPMVLSGFMAGQGGMRMTWQVGSEVMRSGIGSGTGVMLRIRRQEKGLVIHCQQITALNQKLRLSDKSLSTAACTSKEENQTRKHACGSILSYLPVDDDRNLKSDLYLIELSWWSQFCIELN